MDAPNMLHTALIKFVASYLYFFIPESPYSYEKFFNDPHNFDHFNSYSTQDLCDIFNKEILPVIYEYYFEGNYKHLLASLELNDNYVSTTTGYVMKPKSERIDNYFKPVHGTNYISVQQTTSNYVDLNHNQCSETHNLLLPFGIHGRTRGELSTKSNVAPLLSALLSNDGELAKQVLLTTAVIRARFAEARTKFATNGQLPDILDNFENVMANFSVYPKMHKLALELHEHKTSYDEIFLNNS